MVVFELQIHYHYLTLYVSPSFTSFSSFRISIMMTQIKLNHSVLTPLKSYLPPLLADSLGRRFRISWMILCLTHKIRTRTNCPSKLLREKMTKIEGERHMGFRFSNLSVIWTKLSNMKINKIFPNRLIPLSTKKVTIMKRKITVSLTVILSIQFGVENSKVFKKLLKIYNSRIKQQLIIQLLTLVSRLRDLVKTLKWRYLKK